MKHLHSKHFVAIFFPCILLYVWSVLVVQNGDLLYTIQDFSPWLGTKAYFLQSVTHPGGLREWVGDWLTQFFYYPLLGGNIMVVMWTVSSILMVKACRLSHGYELLSLIPVLALLASITQLGYWIFCLKTASYWFGSTVGFLFVSIVCYLYSRVNHLGRCITLSLWMLIGFYALGWMASLGVILLFLLTPWRQGVKRWSQLLIPFVMVSIAVLSYFSKSVGTHWRLPLLWYGFPHVIIYEASSSLLDVAPYVMTCSLALLPLVTRIQRFSFAQKWSLLISVLLVSISLYGANMLNYRNENFHAELRMMRSMEQGDWKELLRIMRNVKRKPTREMVMMKDVALAQRGELDRYAFDYDIRGVKPAMVFNLPIHMVHSAAPTMYYWLGMPNYAYMWCMENYIEYGLSPHWLRLFYKSAVVNGEYEVARKYKSLLQTTLFHKDVEVSEAECNSVRRFMTGHNHLDNDGGYSESLIMRLLSQEEYDTVEGQEIALHYAMLMRDAEGFMKALDHYVDLIGSDQDLPAVYQQALLLFATQLTDDDQTQMADLPVSQSIRDFFDRYRREISFDMQRPVPTEVIGDSHYPVYGKTYWWYYDFYINSKTY